MAITCVCGKQYEPRQAWIHAKCLVANNKKVANKPVKLVANRHGKYSDVEKRRKYMRDYMRARRVQLANA